MFLLCLVRPLKLTVSPASCHWGCKVCSFYLTRTHKSLVSDLWFGSVHMCVQRSTWTKEEGRYRIYTQPLVTDNSVRYSCELMRTPLIHRWQRASADPLCTWIFGKSCSSGKNFPFFFPLFVIQICFAKHDPPLHNLDSEPQKKKIHFPFFLEKSIGIYNCFKTRQVHPMWQIVRAPWRTDTRTDQGG